MGQVTNRQAGNEASCKYELVDALRVLGETPGHVVQEWEACSAGMGGIQFKTITLAIDISVAVFVAFRNRSRLAQGGLFPGLQKQLVLSPHKDSITY